MRKNTLLILLFLFLLHYTFSQTAQEDDRGYIVQIGDMAPEFEIILTNGQVVKISELKGKIVMLQFTASWCSVCRKEMPHIENEIWQVLKIRNDFALYGIDRDEPIETVIKFGKKVGITYPIALDSGAVIFSLFAHKESGITRNVILDKEGRIVFLTRLYNPKEFDAMKEKIFSLLGDE